MATQIGWSRLYLVRSAGAGVSAANRRQNGQTPAQVYLVNPLGVVVHDGPGLTFPTALVLPAGTRAGYDPTPIVGEPIEGDYLWFRLVDGREGYVHRSLLRPS
jgi:hypothetical protein